MEYYEVKVKLTKFTVIYSGSCCIVNINESERHNTSSTWWRWTQTKQNLTIYSRKRVSIVNLSLLIGWKREASSIFYLGVAKQFSFVCVCARHLGFDRFWQNLAHVILASWGRKFAYQVWKWWPLSIHNEQYNMPETACCFWKPMTTGESRLENCTIEIIIITKWPANN